jgi:hypothetical protein
MLGAGAGIAIEQLHQGGKPVRLVITDLRRVQVAGFGKHADLDATIAAG